MDVCGPGALGRMFALSQQGDIVGVGALGTALHERPGADDEFTATLRKLMSRYDRQAIRDFRRPLLP